MSRILVLHLALGIACAWGTVHKANAQEPGPGGPEPASGSPLPETGAEGIAVERASVRLDQEALLATDQPGTLATIAAAEGGRVKTGQPIARLRDDVAEAALAVAAKRASSDIEIRFAKAAHAVAETELEKSLQANQINPKNVPEIEIARLRLSAKRAKLQIEKATLDRQIAELERDQRQAELERHTITSPLDGIVTEVFKHPGEAVQQGDPIMHVVNTERVRVEGYVAVAESARVRRGDPVEVRIQLEDLPPDLAERVFKGSVIYIDPTVERVGAEMIRVWARVENPKNLLKAGLSVTMRIHPKGPGAQTAKLEEAPE